MSDQTALDLNELNEALEWVDDIVAILAQPDYEPTVVYYEIVVDAARRYAAGTLPADFLSDEDVEAAARALCIEDGGNWLRSESMQRAIWLRRARAALLAVADARRTEEEGTS